MAAGMASKFTGGMTLLELLITLLILSILVSVALPDVNDTIMRQRSEIGLKRMELAIEVARNAAITRKVTVTLCRSDDGVTCGGSWQDGALLFTDHNENRVVDGVDQVVRYISFHEFDGTIAWRAFQNRQYLQITALGFTKAQNGNFTFCPRNKDVRFARQLIINRTARARRTIDSDGDGIREDSRGRPLRCE